MVKSDRWNLNKEDMIKIGKGCLIAAGGAILTYLSEAIPGVDWGASAPAVVGISSILINFGLKLLADKGKIIPQKKALS